MICIHSLTTDYTSAEVSNWIKSLGYNNLIRIDADNRNIAFVTYDGADQFIIRQNGQELNLADVKTYWYRRGSGDSIIRPDVKELKAHESPDLNKKLIENILSENSGLNEYIKIYLEQKAEKCLGSFQNASLNKLATLDLAQKHGLKTPKTFILNNRKDLEAKVELHTSLITKAIAEGIYIFNTDYSYYSYTEEITAEQLCDVPEKFSASLFQEKLDKKYEIRTFFLDGHFYSMVIFSQRNKQTQVDFRKYDEKVPNRCIPFNLPETITTKLSALFKALQLNTGSIDLVVDKNNEYYFLEINPVGQFSMVSYPCNYYLEKEVAKFLTQQN